MGKDARLEKYLRRQRLSELEMSFPRYRGADRGRLPKRARNPKWWTEDTAEQALQHQAAWLKAGYQAIAADRKERALFKKASMVR